MNANPACVPTCESLLSAGAPSAFIAGAAPAAGNARAHPASDSYFEIGAAGAIGGQWDIALRDLDVAVGLDADQDGAIIWGELRARQREIEAFAFGRLALAGDSFVCRLIPAALMVDYHPGSAYAVLSFTA